MLARTFIDRSEQNHSSSPIGIDDDILDMFLNYDWPGNVRELLHVIEGSLALLGGRSSIELACLPRHFREACKAGGGGTPQFPAPTAPVQEMRENHSGGHSYFDYQTVTRSSVIPLKGCVQEYEAQCIRNVLRVTGGNVAKAARILQITGAGLRYKIKLLDIEDE